MMRPRRADEEQNRKLWNELTPVHWNAYPVKEFLAGGCSLKPLELAEVGDVTGKRLLHLQCHFGLDTLSWARRGAEVTGADISDESVVLARQLAGEAGIMARFVRSSVYDLPDVLDGRFDVVYTGIGVLPWLPDLDRWAGVIADFLAPGGFFYIFESHPFIHMFDDEQESELRLRYPYFHSGEPLTGAEPHPDYADPSYMVQTPGREWQWALADVVNAVTRAGLRLEYLHEHAAMPFPWMRGMEQRPDGLWFLPGQGDRLPLSFSLRARMPG
jgi:SAM-dependent methyltransferase